MASEWDYFKIEVAYGTVRVWWWDKYGRHNNRRMEKGESALFQLDVSVYGPVEAHTENNLSGEAAEIWVSVCKFKSVNNDGLVTLIESPVGV